MGLDPFCNLHLEPKVLIHSPVAIIHKQSLESILNMETDGIYVSYFINRTDPYDPKYNADGIETNPMWALNIEYKMNVAREICISQGYDFMLNIEHDVIVPKDCLKELLKYASRDSVVGGLYRCRPTRNKEAPLCFKYHNGKWAYKYSEVKNEDKIDVWIIPFGCTLFGIDVLKQIPFKRGIDGSFATDTKNANIKKYIIPSVICGHIDRDGTVYYP